MLNVKRLAVFRAVVRAGSISAAARHLHVSQPAVTKTVRLLEEEVGLALFSRVSGRLVLTPEAEELMSGIERLFGSVGAVEQRAEEIWSTNSATSASRHLRFDPEYWPHFGSDFIRYEVMVLAARDHLFETDGHEFAREQQHRLLLDGLLAPTNLIGRDTAAAIGWAVSWLGPSQALAPPTGFAAPASGLAGWLTYLPLRSPHISVRVWRVQVSRWLVEDLAHPACMCAEIAEFMSTRGHYLLYAEAVHPISLAIRHRVIQN